MFESSENSHNPEGMPSDDITTLLINAGQGMSSPLHNRLTTIWLYQMISEITYIIANIVALPGELVLRRNFGERYIDIVMLSASYVYMLLFTTLASAATQNDMQGDMISACAHLFLVIAIAHLIHIKLRNLRGEQMHSYYPGTSWSFILKPTEKLLDHIYKLLPTSMQTASPLGFRTRAQVIAISYIEPFCWLLVGVLASIFLGGGILVFWMVTFWGLIFKSTMNRFFSKQQILDMIDQEIDGKYQQGVMSGLISPAQAKGSTAWSPMPATMSGQHMNAEQAALSLPPELRDLLAQEIPDQPPSPTTPATAT